MLKRLLQPQRVYCIFIFRTIHEPQSLIVNLEGNEDVSMFVLCPQTKRKIETRKRITE